LLSNLSQGYLLHGGVTVSLSKVEGASAELALIGFREALINVHFVIPAKAEIQAFQKYGCPPVRA
jgi:hypothetical protein